MASLTALKKRLTAWGRALPALWDENRLLRRPPREWSRGEEFVHFWVLVFRCFSRNRCGARAAALAYTSLLALVPLLAVAISVSGSLLKRQGEEPIMRLIDRLVEGVTPGFSETEGDRPPARAVADLVSVPPPATDPAVGLPQSEGAEPLAAVARPDAVDDADQITLSREEIKEQIKQFVANIQTGALGVSGMLALLLLAFGLIYRIEETLNDIWGVEEGRSWHGRVAYYTAALMLGPVLLAAALTLTGTDQVQSARLFIRDTLPGGAWIERSLLGVLPYGIVSLTFTLLYGVMPNTRVRWWAALTGGVFAGCLWQLNSTLGVLYVSRVATYSHVYGGLGLVLLFMLGLYLSWWILLLGAQVAYALQNHSRHVEIQQSAGINQRSRERAALHIMAEVGRAFLSGAPPPLVSVLVQRTRLPAELVRDVVRILGAARLLHEVSGPEPAYAPARSPGRITAADITEAMRVHDGFSLEYAATSVVGASYSRLVEEEKALGCRQNLEAMVWQSGTDRPDAGTPRDGSGVPAPRLPGDPDQGRSE